MARPVSWMHRLPEIRRSVLGSKRSHYPRPDLEDLFQLMPRNAGKLMEALPLVTLGGAHLVERNELIRFLDEVDKAGDAAEVMARRRLAKVGASRRRPRVLVRKDAEATTLETLPKSITLERGSVLIRFDTGQQLVEALYHLSQVLGSEEYSEFEDRFCIADRPREESVIRAEVDAMFADLDERMKVWIVQRRKAAADTKPDTTPDLSLKANENEGFEGMAERQGFGAR